ncbi:MAG TPA: hypothetical protein VEC08_05520 [Nitrososphaerales archaeon]|nr:hypothetical protein [Nitrososphaerales archaeon]
MTKVIFDTSFLMAVADHPTNWLDDISQEVGRVEPVALDCVISELTRLSAGRGKKSKTASVAANIAKGFKRLESGAAPPDEEIMSIAISARASVATIDQELAESLKARRVPVFGLRSGRAVRL